MSKTTNLYDIAVVGCGPAGAVVSRELSRLGYRVAVITSGRRFAGFEGVSERAWEGLRYCNCQRALSAIGPEVRRRASWNGESFEGNRERVVDRRKLDAALVQDVEDAGVRSFNARMRSMERGRCGWEIGFGSPSNSSLLESRFLIDARGRGAGRARSSWTLGPATTSLGRYYTPRQPGEAITWLATFEMGWAWYAADGAGRAVAQIILSTENESLPPRPRLNDYFDTLLRRIPGMDALLNIQQPMGKIHARDAGTALCKETAAPDFARVGDAAFSIDPLSGHGIFEAISGALALAPVVNTLFQHPADTEVALDFYRHKLSADFFRMARTGRDFYLQEQRWTNLPFWRKRQSWPDDEPSHDSPGEARIERRAVSDEGLIRMHEVIVTNDHPRGIWRVAGVPLVELLHYMRDAENGSSGTAALSASKYFELNPEAIETASDWLRWRGLLDS